MVLGFALAVVIGLTLGLLGGGGSILTVPVLVYVLGYGMKEAVPMSLVVVGLTSAFGVTRHREAGTVNLRAALGFAPAVILGALGGAQLGLRTTARVQLTVFALVTMIAAISMYTGQTRLSPAEQRSTRPALPLVLVLGALVGGLTGFVGVGGGFLYVPTLVLLGGLAVKEAVGTSLVLIALSCAAGFATYQGSLRLDWTAVGLFTLLAFVGVAAGTRLVRHVPKQSLRRGFAAFLLVMGTVVLFTAR